MEESHQQMTAAPSEGSLFITYLIYILHGISALGGVLSPALVITAFVSGWPSIIAVVLNYVKRGSVRGTYLESHFRWQIRTFWFALMWVVVSLVLWATFVGIPLALIIAWLAGLWVLYRIIRGGLRLMNEKPMPL